MNRLSEDQPGSGTVRHSTALSALGQEAAPEAAESYIEAGSLTNLLLEDSAHWMDGSFIFDPAVDSYELTTWLETYGVRFTPVISGRPSIMEVPEYCRGLYI